MRRKIEDERDARACLKAAKAAGMSAGEWAREHGIDGRSLNCWRVNLSSGRTTKLAVSAKPHLVELVPTTAARHSDARYVVRLGEITLELDDDFQEESLVRIVRALRAC